MRITRRLGDFGTPARARNSSRSGRSGNETVGREADIRDLISKGKLLEGEMMAGMAVIGHGYHCL